MRAGLRAMAFAVFAGILRTCLVRERLDLPESGRQFVAGGALGLGGLG